MKFKRYFMFFIFVLAFMMITFTDFKVYASSNDAGARGYNISSEWEYIEDYNYGQIKVYGTRYFSGDMYAWMAAYKYYDSIENEMFVLLLCTGSLQSNQSSYWDQKRWNNKNMEIEFSTSEENVELINYSPESTEGNIAIGQTISLNGSIKGEEVELGYDISDSVTYTIKEVPVIVKKDDKTIKINHSFLKYKTNTSLEHVCCQHVKRNNLVLYKIRNYSEKMGYQFRIKVTCTFYRYGFWNSAPTSGYITQAFKV